MRPPLPCPPTRPASGRAALWIAVFLIAAAVAVLFALRGPGPGREVSAAEAQRARELAAAYFAKDRRREAREVLAPLLEVRPPDPMDLVRAAIAELSVGELEGSVELLRRAEELAPDSPEVQFNLGQLAFLNGDRSAAREHFERTLEAAPGDLPTQLALADALEEGEPERAEAMYRAILERGIDDSGSWYMTALYRAGRLLLGTDREEEGQALTAEYALLKGRGVTVPRRVDLERGNFGLILPPEVPGAVRAEPGPVPQLGPPSRILPELAGAEKLRAADLDNDGNLDLVGWGPAGLHLGLSSEGGWSGRLLVSEPVEWALPFDLGNDDDLDLIYFTGGSMALLEARLDMQSGELEHAPRAIELPELPAAPWDGVAIDCDHEGDLDLLLLGSFGTRWWRNDGAAAEGGRFSDATEEAGLPPGTAHPWLAVEDFDTDGDVDLLLGGGSGVALFSNRRGGSLEEVGDWVAEVPGAAAVAPLVADLNGDARPDLYFPAQALPWAPEQEAKAEALLLGQPSGRFRAVDRGESAVPPRSLGELHRGPLDLDLDGRVDVAWIAGGQEKRLHGILAIGLEGEQPFAIDVAEVAPGARWNAALLADLDADLDLELVLPTDEGIEVRDLTGAEGGRLLFSIRGVKDNRRGIGATVELRAGALYQRRFWTGENALLGLGPAQELEWLRITWPNGVVQYDLRSEIGDRRATGGALDALMQTEGLIGSCPFLYAWNGETFEFVSDVLGITPLGLPMAPGMLVPPDSDEYVLVRGEQLRPKDGALLLQFTEELREVTYLDRIRLEVVDHPQGTEVFPNERFCFPPYPQAHTHTVRAPLSPTRALGSDGKDWTGELAAVDRVHAVPFENAPPQFLGLATPHFLELSFDPELVGDAPLLRLLMTGWLYWTEASVNMAAARHPDWEFVPPLFQVPDGAGGWRNAGPPVGFPAGKTKTMVVDVSELLDRADPRLRVFTTLRLYWDSIRLAVDGDDAPTRVTSLEPSSARLWRRGFSAPEETSNPHQPERFTWDRLSELPRWDPHPGLYTRLGEVLPLVTEIDDRLAIMGAGEALEVRFEAGGLPELAPGWRRDYLVFLDGWAKDRDPNTVEALYVEPLPFHGMSGYPYGEGESFPDTEAHRAWRREWNTRPARSWLPSPLDPLNVPTGRPALAAAPRGD